MDTLLIAIAFLFGFIAQMFKLPPLIGFLVAGFVLRALGKEGGETLESISNLGVTLLLFSIGLKLRIRNLMRPEIWAGTSIHSMLVVLLFGPILYGASVLIAGAAGLDWRTAFLLAFAVSFSSTVFAVKSLTDNGDLGSLHGRAAIGILVMQDIIAVLFMTFSTGKLPTLWIFLAIPLLLLCRPLMGWMLKQSGQGELFSLCGLFLALVVGAAAFEGVGLKADLGALFVGILVGWHPRASELRKSLNQVVDLLLVGFFLQIGLEAPITLSALGWAAFLLVLLPIKSIGFFTLLTRFHLRARTSFMASAALSTYSEFGLIVMALGVSQGWVGPEWLVAIALALSFSIFAAAPLNRRAEEIYDPISDFLHKWETKGSHRDDLPMIENGERIAIFGMGRVGMAAYHALEGRFPGRVIGFDRDPVGVEGHREAERNVKLADATDSDFWERVVPNDDLDLVVLAMPTHSANVHAINTLMRHDFKGVVAASAQFPKEIKELRALGVDSAFNLYAQAGWSFGRHIMDVFHQQRPDLSITWSAEREEQ
ncbi:MAG: cation:proton antiporter [Verrucomicrobiales bacterium]|nr:cation:proton antiporter [Verrucomicrobiales bacterium]